MKVGLLFGTFNPVHHGHLIIAGYFSEFTDLEEVWIIVSPQNPFKEEKDLLEDFERIELVKLALGENKNIKVSDVEFELPKPSYTVHTLEHLHKKFPQHKFVLLLGEDNLEHFDKWKEHEKILERCEVYAYPRPDSAKTKFHQHPRVKIFHDVPLMEISSTFIRNAIRNKKDVRYMVPEKVWQIIRENNLYNS